MEAPEDAERPDIFSFHFPVPAGETGNGAGNAPTVQPRIQIAKSSPRQRALPTKSTASRAAPVAGCASCANASDILMRVRVGWGWGSGSPESGSQRVGKQHTAQTMWAS